MKSDGALDVLRYPVSKVNGERIIALKTFPDLSKVDRIKKLRSLMIFLLLFRDSPIV